MANLTLKAKAGGLVVAGAVLLAAVSAAGMYANHLLKDEMRAAILAWEKRLSDIIRDHAPQGESHMVDVVVATGDHVSPT